MLPACLLRCLSGLPCKAALTGRKETGRQHRGLHLGFEQAARLLTQRKLACEQLCGVQACLQAMTVVSLVLA